LWRIRDLDNVYEMKTQRITGMRCLLQISKRPYRQNTARKPCPTKLASNAQHNWQAAKYPQ